MQSLHIVRVVASAVVLLATAGAIASPAASATTRSASRAYPAAQATAVPFEIPVAAGEVNEPIDTGAGHAASTVDMAPGETGTYQEVPAEFLGAE